MYIIHVNTHTSMRVDKYVCIIEYTYMCDDGSTAYTLLNTPNLNKTVTLGC